MTTDRSQIRHVAPETVLKSLQSAEGSVRGRDHHTLDLSATAGCESLGNASDAPPGLWTSHLFPSGKWVVIPDWLHFLREQFGVEIDDFSFAKH